MVKLQLNMGDPHCDLQRFRFGMVKLQLLIAIFPTVHLPGFRFGMVKLQPNGRQYALNMHALFPLWHGKVATHDTGREHATDSASFRFGMVKLQPRFDKMLVLVKTFPLWHGKVATKVATLQVSAGDLSFRFGMVKLQLGAQVTATATGTGFRFGMVKLQLVKAALEIGWTNVCFRFGMVKLQQKKQDFPDSVDCVSALAW